MNLIELKKQFKGLNPKYIYNWAPIPKLITLLGFTIGTVISGMALLIYPQYDDLDSAKKVEAKSKKDYIEKMQTVAALPLYEKQIKEVDKLFGSLLRQLPDKKEVSSLLVDINKAALSRGLDIELFKPTSEVLKDFYAEYPISIKVSGNYNDIGGFAEDLSKLPRIVNLSDFTMVKKDGKIYVEAVAKTYRYLDNEEQEEIKKANAKKNKDKNKEAKK